MTITAIPNWGLGLNTDAMPSELPPGYCTDCTDMRFLNSYAQNVGPADTFSAQNPTVTPYWIGLYASSLSTQGHFHIHAGIAKVFANDFAGTATEITRYTDGKVISSITFVGTTATVTTATAHGLSTSNVVTVYAALPTDYNATGAITSTGTYTFTYTMATTPATNATYTGAYSYNVQSDFTGAIDDRWTGGNINGVFFLNNPINGLYYWNGDVATRLRKMPGSSTYVAVRAFKNYLILINERKVGWSSATEAGAIPLYFAASTAAGNDSSAGVPLAETQGVLVDGLPLADAFIVYARDVRYVMRYIGGSFVFSTNRIPGNDGVRGVSCVVDTPKGHVFFTQNLDVKIHSGGECTSLAEGRVRTVLNTLVNAYRQRAFLCINPPFNEVWVCFNTANASGHADTALIWNWQSDTWGKAALLNGVTFATSGLLGSSTSKNYMLMTTAVPRIVSQDFSSILGGAFQCSIERKGLSLGDEDGIKTLQRSKWSITKAGSNGALTAQVEHGSSMRPDVAPTYASAATYTHTTTNWVDGMATGGRFLALRATFHGVVNDVLRFKTVLIDVSKGGSV